jgi:integrase
MALSDSRITTPAPRTRKPKTRKHGEGSIFQRASDDLWVATVVFDGKEQRFTSKLQNKAIAKRKEWLRLRQAGVRPTSDKWTVAQWLTHWLAEMCEPRYDPRTGQRTGGLEPTTYQSYEILVRRHITPYLGKKKLASLDAEDVAEWQRALNRDGRSAETQRAAVVRLGTALELAEARGHIARNVAAARLVRRPRVPRPRHVQPSETDVQRLLQAIRDDPLEALVWLALGSGLRRAEVAGLRWDDLESQAGGGAVIVARRRVNYLGKGIGRLERAGLKTQDERRVHIGGLVVEVLQARWRHQLAERLAAGTRWQGVEYVPGEPTGYIFTGATGTAIQPRAINDYFAEVRERAGLDVQRFHGLRRIFTTLLDRAGVSDRVVMEMTGHKHLDMTHYYMQPMEVQQAEAAQRLDGLLRELRG